MAHTSARPRTPELPDDHPDAHVCPKCLGDGAIVTFGGIEVSCPLCDGSGAVRQPDTEAAPGDTTHPAPLGPIVGGAASDVTLDNAYLGELGKGTGVAAETDTIPTGDEITNARVVALLRETAASLMTRDPDRRAGGPEWREGYAMGLGEAAEVLRVIASCIDGGIRW